LAIATGAGEGGAPAPRHPYRVEGLGQPVQGQVEAAGQRAQLGGDAGQHTLGQVEGRVAVDRVGRRGGGADGVQAGADG
jgi:hypothetical protein